MRTQPKVLTRDDIIKRLPPQVLNQMIYKAKVIFLGVLKDDSNYQSVRSFSANGRRYSVVDGGISYLPKEALAALQDAVPVYTTHANKVQKEDGINHEDPSDRFKKMPNPRYDITVLEEFKIGKDDSGKNILISLSDQTKQAELDRADAAARAAIRKEIEDSVREDLEEKIRKEVEAEVKAEMEKKTEEYPDINIDEGSSDVPEPISDDDFDNLIGEDGAEEEEE